MCSTVHACAVSEFAASESARFMHWHCMCRYVHVQRNSSKANDATVCLQRRAVRDFNNWLTTPIREVEACRALRAVLIHSAGCALFSSFGASIVYVVCR